MTSHVAARRDYELDLHRAMGIYEDTMARLEDLLNDDLPVERVEMIERQMRVARERYDRQVEWIEKDYLLEQVYLGVEA